VRYGGPVCRSWRPTRPPTHASRFSMIRSVAGATARLLRCAGSSRNRAWRLNLLQLGSSRGQALGPWICGAWLRATECLRGANGRSSTRAARSRGHGRADARSRGPTNR